MPSSRLSRRRALAAAVAASLLSLGMATGPASAAVPAQAAPPPTPQGPLTGRGCTGTGPVSCDLYAKTGTVSVNSTAVPVWGFTAGAADPVAGVGPVLVVPQGAAVTITVHNGLAAPLSLAVPNLTGFATDTEGAAAGAAKAYTFTAARPGTYLYEAGHTVDGARQAAMGLVGALVVRPSAGATSAYGNTASAFDDEAALVLTEIDPAFNANPMTFDLRNYHPTYKLINGKAFPETDPVATAEGRKVLLRYVNAGLADHPMGVAGTRQIIVGVDARPNADAFPLFADTIAPGQTEDAIVGAPAKIDGGKFVVYETAGRLDNAGKRFGTTTEVAFGGMMTYLTNDAVPPADDTIGPAVSKVTVAPASVTALQSTTVTADLTDVANGNHAITGAEYVVDATGLATAAGTGTALTGTFGGPTVTGATGALPSALLQTLSQGLHTVYVRAKDTAGNWGIVGAATFTVTKTGPATTAGSLTPAVTNGTVDVVLRATGDDSGLGGTITEARYFVGTDGPDPGAGTAMALTTGSNPAVAAESATIPASVVSALPVGATSVFVHSRDSFGLWGPPLALALTVTRAGPSASPPTITPNPTDGTVGSPVDPTQLQVSSTFTEPGTPAATTVAGAEGFLDTVGPDGTGFVFLAKDGKFDQATEAGYGLIPLSQVTGLADGPHPVYVHGRDAAGNWGQLVQSTLTVDHGIVISNVAAALTPAGTAVGATTTAIALSATATSQSGQPAAAEWFLDADPGAGNGRPMTITPNATAYRLAASVPPGLLTVGQHTLSVRARSASGTWGKPAFTTLTANARSNLLFADTFDTSTMNWAQQVGNPPVTGGQLNPAIGAYVVDTTPINEAPYQAGFTFTPATLTTPTGTTATAGATIFEALTTANGQVVTVQYQKTATGYRVRLARAGAIATGWIAVTGTGARTITVRFTATAFTSTATLTVSGVAGSVTLSGARTLRVDTVRLGVTGTTAGTGTGNFAGAPLIDNFTSQRN